MTLAHGREDEWLDAPLTARAGAPAMPPPHALQVDLLLANILANPLRVLAPVLAAHTRPGGRLALSGILVPQADDIMQRYAQWFDFEPPLEDEGWVCLSGRRHQA